MKFKINEVAKDPEDGEKLATITISNTYIKMIKSALAWYKGDKDDTDNQKKMDVLRDNIHQVWKELNPS